MKLKELEMLLQQVKGFERPKIQLEQYETGEHIGARMLFTMNSFDDIQDKSILDLGTGCGRLAIGCAQLEAAFVLGIDIDADALQQNLANIATIKEDYDDDDDTCLANIDLLCADIVDDGPWQRFEGMFDVVVMNPPFGTKNNKGIDMTFLRRALDCTSHAVYSLHKSSTRDHILKKAKDWNVKGEVLAQLRYNLPRTYKFHTKQSQDIQVDFFRFEKL